MSKGNIFKENDMVTLAGTQDNEKDLIKAVLELEYNALEAYDETIERLENAQFKAKVQEFRQDHYRHVEELQKLARPMGIDVDGPGAKSMLTAGKIKIADFISDDSAILNAMKTNEYETVMAYENACKKDFLSPELRAICERGLTDERRHRDWMDRAADQESDQAA